MDESNLQSLTAPIIVVGDIHGQFYDVLKLISLGAFSLTQEVKSPTASMCSWVISLIEDTIPLKPFSTYSVWRYSILIVSSSSEATMNQGTSLANLDKPPACMASMKKLIGSMGTPTYGSTAMIPSTTYPWLLSFKVRYLLSRWNILCAWWTLPRYPCPWSN